MIHINVNADMLEVFRRLAERARTIDYISYSETVPANENMTDEEFLAWFVEAYKDLRIDLNTGEMTRG